MRLRWGVETGGASAIDRTRWRGSVATKSFFLHNFPTFSREVVKKETGNSVQHPNAPGLSGRIITFLATVREAPIRLLFFGRAIDDTDTQRLTETERLSGGIERASERRLRCIGFSVSVSKKPDVSSTSIARPTNCTLISVATVAINVTNPWTSQGHLPSPAEMGFYPSKRRDTDLVLNLATLAPSPG